MYKLKSGLFRTTPCIRLRNFREEKPNLGRCCKPNFNYQFIKPVIGERRDR